MFISFAFVTTGSTAALSFVGSFTVVSVMSLVGSGGGIACASF